MNKLEEHAEREDPSPRVTVGSLNTGSLSNALISLYLGYRVEIQDGTVLRWRAEVETPDATNFEIAPDYVNDAAESISALEALGVAGFTLRVPRGWVYIFDYAGQRYETIPFNDQDQVAASALLYVLRINHVE